MKRTLIIVESSELGALFLTSSPSFCGCYSQDQFRFGDLNACLLGKDVQENGIDLWLTGDLNFNRRQLCAIPFHLKGN